MDYVEKSNSVAIYFFKRLVTLWATFWATLRKKLGYFLCQHLVGCTIAQARKNFCNTIYLHISWYKF